MGSSSVPLLIGSLMLIFTLSGVINSKDLVALFAALNIYRAARQKAAPVHGGDIDFILWNNSWLLMTGQKAGGGKQ